MARTSAKKIQSGDYIMANDGSSKDGTSGEKMLVNIGGQRKDWIKRVAGLIDEGDMTEVLKCVLDHVMVEDPESYAVKVEKWRLKTKLDDIEAREKALQEEKQRLVSSLESKGVAAG
jgi:hypothetical protein